MVNQIAVESLPDGTVLKTTAYFAGLPFTHYGVLQRAWNGQVVVHHNSKRIGHAATTDLQEFTDSQTAYVDSFPATSGEGHLRAERARTDVERGVVWTVGDNCEDMTSRALTGRPGSPTRNAFVGLIVIGLAVFALSKL